MMNGEIIKSSAETTSNLADVLERVLDKGVVIAGDIKIQLADIDLLTIKIRLLITSVDKAEKIGLDWWRNDPFLSTQAQDKELLKKNNRLEEKIRYLENKLNNKKRRKR